MKKIIFIALPILLCFLVGFISSRFQLDSLQNWYPIINKPKLTPPGFVFPIAWSVLYLCMGLSIGLVLISDIERKGYLSALFLGQLFLNFTWSISFFYFQNPFLGLVNILLLEALIVFYALKVYPHNTISSYLFIPYIAWVGFAIYLNLYIVLYN